MFFRRASVRYPHDQLIALRRQNAWADAVAPVETGLDVNNLRFRYAIDGDNPPWRPLRAFDDGKKVYIAFPRGIAQGENMIVDRLFAAAEPRRLRRGFRMPERTEDRADETRRTNAGAVHVIGSSLCTRTARNQRHKLIKSLWRACRRRSRCTPFLPKPPPSHCIHRHGARHDGSAHDDHAQENHSEQRTPMVAAIAAVGHSIPEKR